MTSTQKEVGVGRQICHMFVDSFKQEICCSFLRRVGMGGSQNWLFFVDVIITRTL